jgi:hypothetical protein
MGLLGMLYLMTGKTREERRRRKKASSEIELMMHAAAISPAALQAMTALSLVNDSSSVNQFLLPSVAAGGLHWRIAAASVECVIFSEMVRRTAIAEGA